MKKGSTGIRFGVVCAAVALLGACAANKPEKAKRSAGSLERKLNEAWANKPYKDLLAVFGEPNTVMDVQNGTGTAVVLYEPRSDLPAGCSHAFTVRRGAEPTVLNYFCR